MIDLEYVKERLNSGEFSKEKVARELGLAVRTVYNVAGTNRDPKYSTVKKLHEFFQSK